MNIYHSSVNDYLFLSICKIWTSRTTTYRS